MLNISLAFFLNELLSLMDRGYVLTLIKQYMKEVCMYVFVHLNSGTSGRQSNINDFFSYF